MNARFRESSPYSLDALARSSGEMLAHFADDTGDFFNSATRKVRESYPEAMKYAGHLGEQTLEKGRKLASAFTGTAKTVSARSGSALSRFESRLVQASLLYIGYKWLNSSSDRGISKIRRIENHVQTRPIESAVIALSAGYLLGKLLR